MTISVMEILIWVLVGGVAGWLASVLMKTNRRQDWIADIAVGIIGAFIGGFILSNLGVANDAGNLNLLSLLTAFVGAVILLAILKLVRRA